MFLLALIILKEHDKARDTTHSNLVHSSEIKGLHSTFCSREMLQNLLCLCKKKPQVGFFLYIISSNFEFYLMNALVFVISLGKKVDCKPLFSEECVNIVYYYYVDV